LSEDLRLFFAVPTPEEIKRQAQQIQSQCDCPNVKIGWVGPDRMHFTLKFLGDTPEEHVPQLAEVAREVAQLHSAHQLTVAGVGAFPNIHRPRIIPGPSNLLPWALNWIRLWLTQNWRNARSEPLCRT